MGTCDVAFYTCPLAHFTDYSIIPLVVMMKDQFANYVIQKMLDVVDPQQKQVLIEKIRPHLSSLKKFTYGKHLITSEPFCFTVAKCRPSEILIINDLQRLKK